MKQRLRAKRRIFQELLKQIREEAGLFQVDLARKLELPQSFVSKYETGERRLDVLELREICLTLGIPLESFVNRLEKLLKEQSFM